MVHGQWIDADCGLQASDCVVESSKLKSIVAREAIGHRVAANVNQLRYRWEQGCSPGIGDHREPNSADGAQLRLPPMLANLDRDENKGFPGGPAPAFTAMFHAAYERLINFHFAAELTAAGQHHGPAHPM